MIGAVTALAFVSLAFTAEAEGDFEEACVFGCKIWIAASGDGFTDQNAPILMRERFPSR